MAENRFAKYTVKENRFSKYKPTEETPKPEAQPQGRDFLKDATEAANLGISYLNSRTFGVGTKAMSALGAGIAYPIVAGAKALQGEDIPSYSDLYKSGVEGVQGRVEQSREDHPILTGAAEIAGAIKTGRNFAKTRAGKEIGAWANEGSQATGFVNKAANLAQKSARGALVGEAGYRAYKIGNAKPGEELDEAVSGVPYGGIIGGVAPVLGSAVSKLSDTVKKTKASSEDKAAKIVLSRLQKDVTDPRALDDIFKNGTILETGGPQTQRLAEGVAQIPGKSTELSEQFFNEKLSGSSLRAKSSIKDFVSPSTDFYGKVDEVFEKGRARAAPLYDEAFKSNVSMSSPRLDRILAQPAAKAALRETAESMQNAMERVAVPDKELTEAVRDLVSAGRMDAQKGGVAQGLKLKTLDEVKKTLDLSVRDAKRAAELGNGTSKRFQDLNSLRADLIDELDRLDVTARAGPNSLRPEGGIYARARKAAGDYLSNAEALDNGREFLKSDPDQIKRFYSKLGDTEKDMFKAGVARTLREQIDSTFDEGNFVRRIIGKQEMRDRLKAVLSDNEYSQLVQSLNAEDKLFKLRNQILKGSQTARRQAEMLEFANDPSEIVDQVARRGVKSVAFDKMVGFISSKFTGLNKRVAGDVASILYETDPQKQLQILQRLNKAASQGNKQAQTGINAYSAISGAVGSRALQLTSE